MAFLHTFRHIYDLTLMQKLLYAAHLSSPKVQAEGKGPEQHLARPAQISSAVVDQADQLFASNLSRYFRCGSQFLLAHSFFLSDANCVHIIAGWKLFQSELRDRE